MNKKLIGIAMAAVMLLSLPTLALADTGGANGIYTETDADNAAITGPVVPAAQEQGVYVREALLDKLTLTNEEGVALLPLRLVAEACGFSVDWAQSTRTVSVDIGADVVKLTIGSKDFTTEKDKSGHMEAAALLKDGTTYVSADFINKALGPSVDFDGWRISVDSQVDLHNADATLEVKAGESFTVGLEENATTGYAWSYEADKSGVSLVKDSVDQPETPEKMVGAPSFHIWEMKADKAGTYQLTFTYDRSFSSSADATSYTYTIIVK